MFFKECIRIYIYTHHIKLVHVVLCCVSSDLDEIIWNYVMCFCFWIVFFKDSIPHSFVHAQSRCCEDVFQESNIAMGTHFHIFRVVNTMKHAWPCSIFLTCYNRKNILTKIIDMISGEIPKVPIQPNYLTKNILLHRNLSNLLASRRGSWLLGFPNIDSIGHLAHL